MSVRPTFPVIVFLGICRVLVIIAGIFVIATLFILTAVVAVTLVAVIAAMITVMTVVVLAVIAPVAPIVFALGALFPLLGLFGFDGSDMEVRQSVFLGLLGLVNARTINAFFHVAIFLKGYDLIVTLIGVGEPDGPRDDIEGVDAIIAIIELNGCS